MQINKMLSGSGKCFKKKKRGDGIDGKHREGWRGEATLGRGARESGSREVIRSRALR